MKTIKIFYSYSHKDAELREKLQSHLAGLKRQYIIDDWHDRKINAGDRWKEQLDKNLAEANIILLLVSSDFIASDYCTEETKYAVEKQQDGLVEVIPILLRPCLYKSLDFMELQGIPQDAQNNLKAVTQWKSEDDAFTAIATRICEVAERIRHHTEHIPKQDNIIDKNERKFFNPYRGLEAFRSQDSENFFGREYITNELKTLIEKYHFVALIGASGSGKSSLLQAGLVPLLDESWLILDCRPSIDPFYQLAHSIIAVCYDVVEQAEQLGTLPDKLSTGKIKLVDILNATRKQQKKDHVLLIIDQFEELYTQQSELKQLELFVPYLLDALAKIKEYKLPLRILLAYRGDFTDFVIGSFGDVLNKEGTLFLNRMTHAELESVITKPAFNTGTRLEEDLLDTILKDVGEEAGHLPLLQFTLSKLWDKQVNHVLTHQAYKEIGGIGQALAKHADNVLNSFDSTEKKKIRRIFLQLVVFRGDTEECTRQIITQKQIKDWALVSELANHRLVVTQQNYLTKQYTVELVHETLIHHWKPLVSWRKTDREFSRWLNGLQRDIKDKAWLQGDRLLTAQGWLDSLNEELYLDEEERKFIETSAAKVKASAARKLRFAIFGTVLFFIALILGGIANWKWQEAKERELEVNEKFTQSKINQSRMLLGLAELELSKGHHNTAMRLAIEASPNFSETYPERPLIPEIYDILFRGINQQYQGIFEYDSPIKSAEFSPDGENILTVAGNNAYVWGLESRQLLYSFQAPNKEEFLSAWFHSDGGIRVATTLEHKAIHIWDVKKGEMLADLPIAGKFYDFNPDHLVVVTYDKKIRELPLIDTRRDTNTEPLITVKESVSSKLWNVQTGQFLFELSGQLVTFSPDSSRIATLLDLNTIQIWNVNTGSPITKLETSQPVLDEARFSADNTAFLISTGEGFQLRNANTGQSISPLIKVDISEGERTYMVGIFGKSMEFSSDNLIVATRTGLIGRSSINRNKEADIWNTKTGQLITTLKGHSGFIHSFRFSANSDYIVTASSDKTARIWDSITGKVLVTLEGHTDGVHSAVFSPDGRFVLTASDDKTVRLWNATTGKQLNLLQQSAANSILSPDNSRILTNNETVHLFDIKTGHLIRTLSENSRKWNAINKFNPNGSLALATSDDGSLEIFDAKTGHSVNKLKGHSKIINIIEFSHDGKHIITGAEDNDIRIWDIDTPESLTTISCHVDPMVSVKFSPDEKYIVALAKFRPFTNMPTMHSMCIFDEYISKLTVLRRPSGKRLLADNLWSEGLSSYAFSSDGKQLVALYHNAAVRLLNLETGRIQTFLKDNMSDVWLIRFALNDTHIFIGGNEGTHIWNIKTKSNIFNIKGHFEKISPDNTKVMTSSTITKSNWNNMMNTLGSIRIYKENIPDITYGWDLTTGENLYTLQGGFETFTPDNNRVVTTPSWSDHDRDWYRKEPQYITYVWDIETGEKIFTLQGRFQKFSSDNKQIITLSDDSLYIYDSITGQLQTFFNLQKLSSGESTPKFSKYSHVISHDDKMVITNSDTTTKIQLIFSTLDEMIIHTKKILPPRDINDKHDDNTENIRLTCAERKRFFLDDIPRCKK